MAQRRAARVIAAVMAAGIVLAGCSGRAEPSSSATPPPGAEASSTATPPSDGQGLRWIVAESAVAKLEQAGLGIDKADRLFGDGRTFLIGTRSPTTSVLHANGYLPTVSFASYQALVEALKAPGWDARIRAVVYDNERWPMTPQAEQQEPAKYEKLVADLVHAHHLLLVATPAADLAAVLAPGETKHYPAYLRLHIAADAARYADVFEIQAQGAEVNATVFTDFVRQATAQAKAANPHVQVLAGISTNPDGRQVSAEQLTAAVTATRGIVDGYWLNVPSEGKACPKCGTAQPQVALPLLTSLAG